jgi:hypothetical protein
MMRRLREAPARAVGAFRVDVEIDDVDAALRLAVAAASVPGTAAQAHIADLGKP